MQILFSSITWSNNLAMLDDLNPKLLIICKFFISICLLMFLESHFFADVIPKIIIWPKIKKNKKCEKKYLHYIVMKKLILFKILV